MAGTPLDSSSTSTPPGAVSPEDSTRMHGEYLEDTESESTRKRPRLDRGRVSGEAMSTEGASPVPQAASPKTPDRNDRPSVQRPSSRVTINMKSPSQAMASTQDLLLTGGLPEREDETQSEVANTPTTPTEDATMAGAHSSTAISITSSPAQSPEIEVADLEDMDQDPNTSQWRPLGEALREQNTTGVFEVHEPFSLADQFPKLRGNPDLRESLEETVSMIEKGRQAPLLVFSEMLTRHQVILRT
jgi:ubiquitin carboxyl-terminal hydrolase 34